MEELEEKIKTILLNHNFCDEGLLDSCVEELAELFQEEVLDSLVENEGR